MFDDRSKSSDTNSTAASTSPGLLGGTTWRAASPAAQCTQASLTPRRPRCALGSISVVGKHLIQRPLAPFSRVQVHPRYSVARLLWVAASSKIEKCFLGVIMQLFVQLYTHFSTPALFKVWVAPPIHTALQWATHWVVVSSQNEIRYWTPTDNRKHTALNTIKKPNFGSRALLTMKRNRKYDVARSIFLVWESPACSIPLTVYSSGGSVAIMSRHMMHEVSMYTTHAVLCWFSHVAPDGTVTCWRV